MAIEFARVRYISRRAGGCAVRSAAYNARESFREEISGRRFSFGDGDALRSAAYNARIDLVSDDGRIFAYQRPSRPEHHEIMLPESADPRFYNPEVLWNAANRAEKRSDSQLAREFVLALPANKEITREDRIELVRSFVHEHLTSKGLAVQVDLHVPHNAETAMETANYHAHLLVVTRRIEGNRLAARKAVDLDPQVRSINGQRIVTEGERWGKIWRDHQNDYFSRNGIGIAVDPISATPGQYLGPIRFRDPQSEKARLERLALDKAVEQRHEPPQPQRTAEVIALHSASAPERAGVAAVIAGWHRPEPQPAAPEPPRDHLADDLLRAITGALGSRDPQEQRERLAEGIDKAVYVHGGNHDEPPSPLARSLMRVATLALSSDEPEPILTRGMAEAIHRHDLRQRQAEVAPEPAPESPTAAQDAREPESAAIGRAATEEHPAGSQRGAVEPLPGERSTISPEARAQLERDAKADHVQSGWIEANVEDVAREISPQYRAASDRMENLNKQIEGARWSREQFYLERQAAAYRQPERRAEMGWLRRGLHAIGDKLNVPILKDQELENWRALEARATRGENRAAVKVKFLEDALETATADVWKAYDRAKAEAERVLIEQQQIASAASERLRVLDAGERVPEKAASREDRAEREETRPAAPARKYKSADEFWRAGVEAGRELRKEEENERQRQAEAFVRRGVDAGREAREELAREQAALAAKTDPERVKEQLVELARQRKRIEQEIAQQRDRPRHRLRL